MGTVLDPGSFTIRRANTDFLMTLLEEIASPPLAARNDNNTACNNAFCVA